MESSPTRDSKAYDTRNYKNPSLKPQDMICPSSKEFQPPPNFNSLVDFPAIQPPTPKLAPTATPSLMMIGSLPISSAPPSKTLAVRTATAPAIAATSMQVPVMNHLQPSSEFQQRQSPKAIVSQQRQQLPVAISSAAPFMSTAVPAAVQIVSNKIRADPVAAPNRATPTAAPIVPLQQAHSRPPTAVQTQQPVSMMPHQSSKLLDAYSGRFDFKPCYRINGKPCLSFFEFDKDRMLSKIQPTVIVKFSHNRPKFVDFRVFLDSKKFEKSYRIVEFDKKHVFIVFESFHDFVKLWIMRSVVIKGFKARFFSWDENFNPRIESFIAPVWIHLPGLPIYLFEEDVILSVGALFGKTIYIDPACIRKDKIGMLSFCVSMDVRIDKIEEFWVEFVGEGIHVTRFLQRVVYGDIPPYCTSCKHLGHPTESCKVLDEVDLREELKGKKVVREVERNDHVIPTVSVFKRLGVLSDPTKGKDLGESSTARGSHLEEVEVVDVTDDEEIELAKENSATFAVREPSLEPHNSLGSNNGAKPSGVLDTRVNKLQNGSRFGPLAAVIEEETAVENRVLQEKSAVCVEEATLTRDISLNRPEEKGSPSATQSQVLNLQTPEEMGEKLSMGCPETDLEKHVLQNSAADSDEEATLLADFSQLVHGGSVIPSGVESQVARLQDAEEIKAIAAVNCPEKRFEVGVSLQSAADFNETQTLTGHISPTRDNQAILFGDPEISLPGLQNDASLDIIAAVSEELSSDESGVSTYAATTSNEHNFCSRNDTDLILGPTESREDHLQVQGEKQVSNMLVNQVYSSKVIITDPVTKEVIVLPPPSQSLCAPTPISATEGMSNNERKKWKKKKRREAEKKGQSVVEPLSSSNASKDISVFDDLVYPVITVISEDEACTGNIPRHSRLHPSYKERSSKFNSLDYLDLHEIWATKRKDTDTMGKGSLADEALLVTPSSSGIPKAVSSSATKDQTGEALPVLYSKEELAAKILEKLNLSRYEEMQIELHNVVQQQIDKLGKRCPWNDRAVNIIVDWYINAMIWNTPDKKPPKDYQDYLRSIKKDKIRKDMIEPASQAKSDYNLRSKIKTQRKDSSYTKFFKENFVPP